MSSKKGDNNEKNDIKLILDNIKNINNKMTELKYEYSLIKNDINMINETQDNIVDNLIKLNLNIARTMTSLSNIYRVEKNNILLNMSNNISNEES